MIKCPSLGSSKEYDSDMVRESLFYESIILSVQVR